MAVDYEERYLGKEFVSKKGKKAVVVACHPKSEMYKMPSITVRFEDVVKVVSDIVEGISSSS